MNCLQFKNRTCHQFFDLKWRPCPIAAIARLTVDNSYINSASATITITRNIIDQLHSIKLPILHFQDWWNKTDDILFSTSNWIPCHTIARISVENTKTSLVNLKRIIGNLAASDVQQWPYTKLSNNGFHIASTLSFWHSDKLRN